jgi:hypothetical protein
MEYTKEQVLKIVDSCVHSFASSYRNEAKEIALYLMEEHEPTPPTVRPMSELPKDNEKHYLFAYVDVSNFKEVRYIALCNVNNVGLLASWGRNFKSKGHLSLCGNFLLVGWLYELPNPNDIEL